MHVSNWFFIDCLLESQMHCSSSSHWGQQAAHALCHLQHLQGKEGSCCDQEGKPLVIGIPYGTPRSERWMGKLLKKLKTTVNYH